MKFGDIIKKSFLNNFTVTDITTSQIVLVLGVTLIIALYIFFIYRILNRKNFYNKNFNISIVALAVITASIIIAIQSSIVVSLGMVGALSIVRFRTAIKDPMDLVFLFWSLAVGIICGVGLFEVAILSSVITTIVVFALDWVPISKVPLLLVVQANGKEVENEILNIVEEDTKYYKVKSRNFNKDRFNIIVEIRGKNVGDLFSKVSDITGVDYVSIIDHDGETAF